MTTIKGGGNLDGYQPINLDQSVERGKLTEQEADRLGRLDTNNNRILDKSEITALNDGDGNADQIELKDARMPGILRGSRDKTRGALAAAFVTTQSGALRQQGAEVIAERLETEAGVGSDISDPAQLSNELHRGGRFDRTSLAQVTVLCETAESEFKATDDPERKSAIAASLRFALFQRNDSNPIDGGDMRQRQLWTAGLSRVSPELLEATIVDSAQTIADPMSAPLDLMREQQVLRDLTTAIDMSQASRTPIRAGGRDGEPLDAVFTGALESLLDAGDAQAAAALLSANPHLLPADRKVEVYARLATGLGESGQTAGAQAGALRADMYATLSADSATFQALPSAVKAQFAHELYDDMRARGEEIAGSIIETALQGRREALAPVRESWSAAVDTICDPRASDAQKVAALDGFNAAAQELGLDQVFELIKQPGDGDVLSYPELEWIGPLAHAAVSDDPRAGATMLQMIEEQFTDLDGTSFAPEPFRRNFGNAVTETLTNPMHVESFGLLKQVADDPSKLDPFVFDVVAAQLAEEFGAVPQRGKDDDPLQSQLNAIYGAHRAAETVGQVALVAVEVGATVLASSVAGPLGTMVSMGFVTRDLAAGAVKIELSRAFEDVGVMNEQERKQAEFSAWIGMGMSVGFFGVGELTSVGGKQALQHIGRMSRTLVRTGRTASEVADFVRATAGKQGLSRSVANELAERAMREATEEAGKSTGRQVVEGIATTTLTNETSKQIEQD